MSKTAKNKPSGTAYVYTDAKPVRVQKVRAGNGPKPDEGKKSRKSA